MTEIVTEVARPDPLLPLPDFTSEVLLTSESLPISTWPHSASNCPNSWSASLESPCPSCHCFVCDVPLSLCDDISNHITADGALAEWRRAKRRRNKLAQAWNDIPALVNLIVTLSIDEASKVSDAHPVVHPTVSSTLTPMTTDFITNNNANNTKTTTPVKSPAKSDDITDSHKTADIPTPIDNKSNIHFNRVDKVITPIKPEPV